MTLFTTILEKHYTSRQINEEEEEEESKGRVERREGKIEERENIISLLIVKRFSFLYNAD